MFVNNCVHVAVVFGSSIGGSLVHLGLHLIHITLHAFLNIWILVQHKVHQSLLEIFVFDTRCEVHLVMHFILINHHLEHHFVLIGGFFLASCAEFLHVLKTQFLLLLKDFKSLLLRKFRSRRTRVTLLIELTLLSGHYKFGGRRIRCHCLVGRAECFEADV